MTIVADAKFLSQPRSYFDGAAKSQDGTIGLREGLALLARRRRFIIAVIFFGTLAAAFLAISIRDVYTTNATLVLERRDAQLSEVDEEFEGTELNRAAVETEIDVISSRGFARHIVEVLELLKDPVFNPFLPSEPEPWTVRTALPKSYALAMGLIGETLSFSESDKNEEPSEQLQRQRTISTFLSKLKVYRSGESLAMSIEFSHPQPKRAAALANAVATSYVSSSLQRKKASITSAINVLRARLSQLAADIAEKERGIADHVRDNQLDIYRRDNRRDEELRAEIDRLKSRLQLALAPQTEDDEAFSTIGASQLKSDLAESERELRNRTLADIRHRAMEQELETDRTRYNTMAERLLNLDSRVDLQNPSARVISKARVPLAPSYPKRKLIVAGGFMASVALAITMALMFEALVTRIRSSGRATEISRLPNLAYLPETPRKILRRRTQPVEYVKENPQSFFAEAMRSLFMACRSSNVENPPKVIVLTSALPGEGKSTAAASLAVTTATLGHRTVLADFDLHRCGATKALGVSTDEGRLRDFLQSKCKTDELIKTDTGLLNLDLVPANTGPDLPSSLLSSNRMRRLMRSLRSRYDIVIVDTPASLIVNDVNLIAPFADAAVLVVRWGETREAELSDAIERLRQNHVPLIGTCINRVAPKDHARYGYGQAQYQYISAAS